MLIALGRSGGMADAEDSKSFDGDIVRVRPPSPALKFITATLIL